jgi:hypothetical protein
MFCLYLPLAIQILGWASPVEGSINKFNHGTIERFGCNRLGIGPSTTYATEGKSKSQNEV